MHNQRRPLYIDDRGRPFAVNPRGKKYYNVNLSMQGGSINNPQNTSGDFVLQDDSDDDLYQLNDENDPPLHARYEGLGSFTFGYRDESNGVGDNTYVIGGNADHDNSAPGGSSISIGYDNIVGYSTAFELSLNEAYSFAFGYRNQVENKYSISIGGAPESEGNISQITGKASIGLGHEITVTGNNSYAIGKNNSISSDNSVAIGLGTNIDSDNVINIGGPNVDSTLIGSGLNSSGNIDTILGSFNSNGPFSETETVLLVGSGSSDSNRDRAFVIYDDGTSSAHVDSIYLTLNSSPNDFGNPSIGSIINRNVSTNSSFNDSVVFNSTLDADTADPTHRDSIAFNLTADGSTSADFYNSLLFNSTFTNINEQINNSYFLSTNLVDTDVGDYLNSSGSSAISVFSFNGKTILGFSNGDREGSVIISGGSVGDVANSVAIGATVSTTNKFKVGKDIAEFEVTDFQMNGTSGASGTFTDANSNTITVNNGIITALS